jgi:ribosomal protein L7/L12
MDYCRSCGTEVAAGTYQCPSCGALIDEFGLSQTRSSDEILNQEIRALVRSDGMIAAVKRYREATGCDLKTAKDAVERLMIGGDRLRPPVEHVEAEVLKIAQTEGKMAAIKHYREATGCGLYEARQAVELLVKEHGMRPGEHAAPVGCAGVLLLLLGVGFAFWLTL